MTKKRISMLGLLFITFLAAIQYVFLQAVPDSVSTFSFIFITNLIGILILGAARFKSLKKINRSTLKKGIIFAVELTGMNYFLIQGSKGMDSVAISGIVAMYFVFVTPILLILRKKVSFFSWIASAIAVVALILMLGVDTENFVPSIQMGYLLLADLFFAAYVVSISILGENEDSTALTLSQMIFVMAFALIGWGIEAALGVGSFSFPSDTKFWISALFIGVCIRALYGIIQMSCQKNVSAICSSLIFSSEIIITFIMNPIMSRLMGTTYTNPNGFQLVGCIFFIFAAILADDAVLDKIGYSDINGSTVVDEKGNVTQKSSVSRKIVGLTLNYSLIVLVAAMITCIVAINFIRNSTVENSAALGEQASEIGSDALTEEVISKLSMIAEDKAEVAETKLRAYERVTENVADYAAALLADPDNYGRKEISYPLEENQGKWAMQRALLNEDLKYEDLADEIGLLGNIEPVMKSATENTDNIATIYIGMEDGFIISYDPNSGDAAEGGEIYYDFKDTDWYMAAQETDGDYMFTDAYEDGYGRGLTMTCISPIRNEAGKYMGCVAVDILIDDLNETIVSDGITEPNKAILINSSGQVLAGGSVNSDSSEMASVYDGDVGVDISSAADEILSGKNGISQTGDVDDDNTLFVSYHEIEDTGWILCVTSPASVVMVPVDEIRTGINENTDSIINTVKDGIIKVTQVCLILAVVILITVSMSVGAYTRRIMVPLKKLESDVIKISEGNMDWRSDVSTNDEIGSLANAFNEMTESLKEHIIELKEITEKESRLAAELGVAAKIQASALPADFPDNIYAFMTPAKEVGGDFYDFFRIDERHMGLVMADVSGKGIPAAMFMMISKVLLKRQCLETSSPAEILRLVNNQLCDGNEEEMFVTVWLGIVDTQTGIMTAASAGHEYPVVYHKGGQFELLKDRHGFVLAGMENSRYRDYEISLGAGDRLFLYTDGIAEATNAENELFGTDRLVDALNSAKDASISELVGTVLSAVDGFVKEAPQFDDMTVLVYEQKE